MANDKNFKIKNGLSAKRYLQNAGVDTAGANGPFGVFDTTLYTGTNATKSISNSLDLATDGGLVWIKSRNSNNTSGHYLFDTERGVNKVLHSHTTGAEYTQANTLTAFNSNGFTLGNQDAVNSSVDNFVSWSFKKQAKFFDIVTYTGDGTNNRSIAHSLGSVPGVIIIKCLNSAESWMVYHRSLAEDTGTSPSSAYSMTLNSTSAASTLTRFQYSQSDTVFKLAYSSSQTNQSGNTYVAYLFAHDTASDSNIKCGSYTGNGSTTGPEIDLGWDVSWLLVKNASASANWLLLDTKRGMPPSGSDQHSLLADSSTAELVNQSYQIQPITNGFQPISTNGLVNANGNTYIYMAIRAVVQTKTLDLSTGHTFSITPTEALDVLFSNPPASGIATGFTVEVDNSAGGYALTWPSSVKWHLGAAPTATATKELYTFVTTDGGTTYYGKLAGSDIA